MRGQGRGGGPGPAGSEQAVERVAVERIAVLEIGVHHGVAAVAAEAFEPGGMHAEIHPRGERAALEAVAAEGGWVEAGGGGAGLHDARDGARIDRRGADGGRAGDAAARGREPDAAEQRAVGDPGGVLPAAQRAHRAEFGGAERQRDGDTRAGAVALGERQGEAQPARVASRCSARIAASLRRAAIRYLHYLAGCAVPTAEAVVGETLAGIRRDAARRGEFPAQKLAAAVGVLREILAPIGDDLRDRALRWC